MAETAEVLTVGDGNFSFSLALRRRLDSLEQEGITIPGEGESPKGLRRRRRQCFHLTATSFDDRASLLLKYPESDGILRRLEGRSAGGVGAAAAAAAATAATKAAPVHIEASRGPAGTATRTAGATTVVHGVDATDLGSAPLDRAPFDAIVFNFPHTGVEDFRRHQALLAHFFDAARPLLREATGQVQVALANDQPTKWAVVEMAGRAGLELLEGRPFAPETEFPGYEVRRHHTGRSFHRTRPSGNERVAMTAHLFTFVDRNNKTGAREAGQQRPEAWLPALPSSGAGGAGGGASRNTEDTKDGDDDGAARGAGACAGEGSSRKRAAADHGDGCRAGKAPATTAAMDSRNATLSASSASSVSKGEVNGGGGGGRGGGGGVAAAAAAAAEGGGPKGPKRESKAMRKARLASIATMGREVAEKVAAENKVAGDGGGGGGDGGGGCDILMCVVCRRSYRNAQGLFTHLRQSHLPTTVVAIDNPVSTCQTVRVQGDGGGGTGGGGGGGGGGVGAAAGIFSSTSAGGGPAWRCVVCARDFGDAEALAQHRRAKHGRHPDVKPDWFQDVQKSQGAEGAAGADKADAKQQEQHWCRVCQLSFPSAEELSCHRRSLQPITRAEHPCPTCGRIFVERRAMLQHANFCTAVVEPQAK